MTPEPIQIRVLREAGTWTVAYDDVVLEYETHDSALAASIELARTFGREGHFSAVVMGMITSLYGPTGFIKTVPNRRKPIATPSTPSTDELLAPAYLDILKQKTSLPTATKPAEPLRSPLALEAPRKMEKQPRLLRIASALSALDKH